MGKIFVLFFCVLAGIWVYFERDMLYPYVVQFLQVPILNNNLQMKSPAFANHGAIPSTYTCDGEGINPPLTFTAVPGRTESFVLFMEDLNGPSGVLTHWNLFHIAPTTTQILENSIPDSAIEGKTSFSTNDYTPPCPPLGTTHSYVLTLYALSTTIDGDETMTKSQLMAKMQGFIIGRSQLFGTYTKRQ